MVDLAEIHRAVETIEQAGNQSICILHCIASYPAESSTIRLKNILALRKEFPDYWLFRPFCRHRSGLGGGYSGACMLEKHFTLDRIRIGMDHQMATESEEMATLVRNCHNAQIALGDAERIVSPEEMARRMKMRRSIVAISDPKAGTRLAAGDLDAKRRGTGLPPEKITELIGKTLLGDIEGNTLIMEDDISE